MEKVTGIMRQEEKSSTDQMETVLCMSLEEMEWSISIAKQGEDQECGDVIFLIVMVYCRASTSTLVLLQQVFVVFVVFLVLSAGNVHRSAVVSSHLLHSGV